MRALAPGLLGCAALWAALCAGLAGAQGLVIPDLRNPALYNPPPAGASCRVCGEIRSIREVGGGSVAVAPDPTRSAAGNPNDWAVVGAAITLPTGPDVRDAQPRIGAVGTQEMVARFGANTYEITIRMDDGERKVLQRRDGTLFRVGDRVTVSAGMLEKL